MRQIATTSDAGFSPAITVSSTTKTTTTTTTTATTPIQSNKPRKHKNTAGKVILAAIVYHDNINERPISEHQQKIANQEEAKAKSGGTTPTRTNKSKGNNENSSSLTWSKRKSKREKGEQINKLEEHMSSIETSSSPIKTKMKAAINGCYTTTSTTYENNYNTSDQTKNSSIVTSSKVKGKFSNLFSKKKKTSPESTTLIDSAKDNGYSSTLEDSKSNSNSLFVLSKTNQHHQIPPTKINERENSNQATRHHQQEIEKKQINVREEQQVAGGKNYYKENDKEQVIEFKFDLIVNKERDENGTTTTATNLPTKSKGKKKQSNCYNLCDHDSDFDDFNCNAYSDEQLRSKSKLMNNCKLNDNVNELVESFVLDSSDVCFMSTGKQSDQKLANLNDNKIAHNKKVNSSDEFDYLSELLLHTLTYSFELLEVKKGRLNRGIRPVRNKIHHTSDDNDNDDELAKFLVNNTELNFQDPLNNEHHQSESPKSYSIEISATLFLKKRQHLESNEQTETGIGSGNSADDCYYYCDDDDDDEQETPTHGESFDYHIVDLLADEENYCEQMNELLLSFEFNRKKQNLDEYLAKLNCDDSKTNIQTTEHQSSFKDFREDSTTKQHFANKLDKNNNFAHRIDEQNSVDSVNIEEGLKLVERIKDRLKQLEMNLRLKVEQLETTSCECDLSGNEFISKQMIDNKLLIIGLKLKEKIDSGGSFSNRMCLIDFDPNLTEMYPIFESIFNGQALSYLKRHKLHVKNLESNLNNYLVSNLIWNNQGAINDDNRRNDKTKLNSNFHDTCFMNEDNLEKQHHQVASRSKLIRAEWILYKQLSSALIRTLMIVHVHRLTNLPSPSSLINRNNYFLSKQHKNDREYYENYLMRENLIVLKFARSIQRASTIRLKRRKRHLKSHLASSNISIASNVTETTTTNDILTNLFMNQRANFDSHATTPSATMKGYSHFYPTEPTRQLIGVNSPSNLESAIRDHNSRRRMYSDRNRQQQYFGSQDKHNNRYYVEPISQIRATFQHNNHQQQPDTLATESSSMSNSSGSQTRQVQSSRSSRRRDFESFKDNSTNFNNNINNFSDSDSITSANLNSCSSSSFNRLQHSSLSHHRNDYNNHRHHHTHYFDHHRSSSKQRLRRDIELRWIAKQSSSRTIMQEQQQLFHNKRTPQLSRTRIELSDSKVSPAHRRSSSVSRVMTPSQVIQIDCSPTNTTISTIDNNLSSLSSQNLQEQEQKHSNVGCKTINGDNTISNAMDDNTDNVSDICSIVAEPPKQLKLEEFLNQLSSIIAPSKITRDNRGSNNSSDQDTTFTECFANKKRNLQGKAEIKNSSCRGDYNNSSEIICKNKGITPLNRDLNDTICSNGTSQVYTDQNTTSTAVNEDDDDCKSHSSILEQLSSLALESNSRLNNRNQLLHTNCVSENEQVLHHFSECHKESQEQFVSQPLDCTMILENSTTNSDRSSTNNNKNNNGDDDDDKRIESKNSQQISKIPTTTIGGHLQKLLYNSSPRKITQPRVSVKDPSSVEERLRALSISCQVPSSSPSTSSSGALTLSTDSSCSSPSSSAENNNNNRSLNSSRNLAKPLINQPSTMNDLYASVTRGQSVKSELC